MVRVRAAEAASSSGSAGSAASVSGSGGDESGYWAWRDGLRVHYRRVEAAGGGEKTATVVLLPGFGVGTFHYERNIGALAEGGLEVWALDLAGQGKSWPEDADSAVKVRAARGEPLRYSIDFWVSQVVDFLEGHVEGPVFLAGNSLGGFLATAVAHRRPDLVRGLVLLNATPFWAFAPHPDDDSTLSNRVLQALTRAGLLWDAALPAPGWLQKFIEAVWWDRLRAPATIKGLLGLVYADPKAVDEQLVAEIIEPTRDPHAVSAFASIVFAHKPRETFDEMLASIREVGRVPVGLMYGREDPWVVPLWGQRAKRALGDEVCDYYELSPAGHCPHHEAPAAVNSLMGDWIRAVAEGVPRPKGKSTHPSHVSGGRDVEVTLLDGSPRNVFEHTDLWTSKARERATSK